MFRQLADALGLEINNIEDHILGDEKVSDYNLTIEPGHVISNNVAF